MPPPPRSLFFVVAEESLVHEIAMMRGPHFLGSRKRVLLLLLLCPWGAPSGARRPGLRNAPKPSNAAAPKPPAAGGIANGTHPRALRAFVAVRKNSQKRS